MEKAAAYAISAFIVGFGLWILIAGLSSSVPALWICASRGSARLRISREALKKARDLADALPLPCNCNPGFARTRYPQ